MIEIVDLGNGVRVIRGYRVWQLRLRKILDSDLCRSFPGACYEPELRGVIYSWQAWSTEFSPAQCYLCPEPYRAAPLHGFEVVKNIIEYAGGASQHRHGWYAFSSFRMALDYLATLMGQNLLAPESAGWIIGSCLLAGKIIRGDMGYRATHAAIEAIAGPEPGAIFIMRRAIIHSPEELYELLRNPPVAEMDWPFEADFPVCPMPDFRRQFDEALYRTRGPMVEAARKGKHDLFLAGLDRSFRNPNYPAGGW